MEKTCSSALLLVPGPLPPEFQLLYLGTGAWTSLHTNISIRLPIYPPALHRSTFVFVFLLEQGNKPQLTTGSTHRNLTSLPGFPSTFITPCDRLVTILGCAPLDHRKLTNVTVQGHTEWRKWKEAKKVSSEISIPTLFD
ncbi:hypothetical protein AMECASPLE_032753 [Ameca splendens]|uniref:Uncharacterized protein n=1 Tax=Ameca splendens TaxID=208324 RepID=A0ABV0XVH5_9TELE